MLTVRVEKGVPVVAHVELGVVAAGKALVQRNQVTVPREVREERRGNGLALEDHVVPRLLVQVVAELEAARPGPDDTVVVALAQLQRRALGGGATEELGPRQSE